MALIAVVAHHLVLCGPPILRQLEKKWGGTSAPCLTFCALPVVASSSQEGVGLGVVENRLTTPCLFWHVHCRGGGAHPRRGNGSIDIGKLSFASQFEAGLSCIGPDR